MRKKKRFSCRHRQTDFAVHLAASDQDKKGRGETRTIDAASLITHVPAVVLMVALAAAMDASAITAFKLIGTAGGTS